MINNYIRGGQIFLHKMRMLKQVWDKSLLLSVCLSFIICIYLSHDQFRSLDYAAGITYVKAIVTNSIGESFKNEPYIRAVTNKGIYSNKIRSKEILRHGGFKRKYAEIIEAIISWGLRFAIVSSGFFIVIVFIWSRAGSKTGDKKILSGGKIFTASEVSKFLGSKKKSSDFLVGGMNLVKNSETTHILVTGTTGSGKTTCMNEILPQVRSKNQPAIVVDYTGSMTEKYYDSSRGDVIIGIEDEGDFNKCSSWDFWRDVLDEDNLAIISNALFTDKGSGHDEMWNNASKQFFKDSVMRIGEMNNPKVSLLYQLLCTAPLSKVHTYLKGTASSSMLDPKNEKTAMSVRTNTIAFLDWMENFKETSNKVSLSKWFRDLDLYEGKWLFFRSSPKQRVKLRSYYSMLLDLCMNQVMELGENLERRIWLVIDELPALKKLPSLAPALSEFRKYGGCILASMQSPHQLFDIYGQHSSYSMLDQFNTKFIFRTDEHNFASYLCKGFGDIEYKESQENYSYGSHEMRDGVNTQTIEKRKPLLTPKDLANLDNLEAFVKMPEKDINLAKIQLKIPSKK